MQSKFEGYMGKGILTALKVVALPLLLTLSACDDVSVFVASGSRSFAIMNSQNLISRSIFRLEWTKEKYADHYDIQIASDPLCEHVVSEIKGLKTTSYDFEALADGKYNLCVFSRTQKTKLAAVNNGLPLTVDQSNPIVTIPSQIRDESQPFIPQISVEDLSEFSILWTKAAGDGTVSISNPQSVNPTLSADKNGVYVITITVTDSLGHKVEQLYSFVWKGSSVPGLTFQSLARSGVASDGSINLSERNDPSPIWILNQSGASSISYSLPQADPSHALACDASQIYDETSIPTAQNLTVEDSYVICVKLSLDDGQTVYGKSDPVVLDLTPPTFTSLANANAAIDGIINNAEKFLVSPMWTLVGSGYTAARYTSAADDSGGALICGSAALYDQTQIPGPSSLTVDGSYALCVELSDAAGNRVYAKSVQIVRASAVPTVNAGADQLTKDPVLLNATATDTTSGISSYAWSKVSGPGTISFSAASSEDTTASASVDGTYVLRLSVTNLDGNTAWDDVIFVWDSTAPTSPSSVSFGSSYAASTNFSMSWVTSSDPHFSTHNTKICTASDCSTGCISPSTSIASPATATGVDGTSYFACVQAVDSLGNASPFISSGASLLVDTSPPLATTLSIAAAAAITSTASNPLTLAATGADQMYITNTASCTSGGTWEAYATSKTWTLGQSNSTATVYAKFRDNAGNESSCLSDSIIHDSQAPTGPTLNISGGATSTTATTVTLSLSASDNSSMEMFVTNTAGCASGGSWESYATSKNWALAQTNATATVFVKYRDAALNETACVNDTITQISASGPSGASVLIENGATTTASPNVSLNLSVSGATDVYITNAAGCVNGGVWETVAATKGWVLSLGATTTATVYVKFRDASMVESSCVSDSIDLTRSSIFSNGDFETGDLSSWTNSIAGRWVVDNSNVDSGSFSAHTVAVANSSTACIQQTVDLSSLTGTFLVTWRWQYDTESGADYARFFTDSTQQFQRSGAPGVWQDESYSLTAGSSTVLKWCYRKNASGQSAGDFVRLDEVKVLSPLLYAPVSLSTTASNAAVALSITPPTGSQTGYLTVRRASSAPSFVPVNGTS
ncbi:MAG: hypothetical protein EOP07_16025, partial [Proteobacteria bacterium]